MSKKTIQQLYAEHTGKRSDKWSSYLIEYDRLFADYCRKTIRLLEIGIQNGGSLDIWSKYFSNASILIGCDINQDCTCLSYEDSRIEVIIGDVNNPDVHKRVFQRSPAFDIIIDDGSHVSKDIIKSFALYFPLLADGGVFIVEDLHCSYWEQFEGGLHNPYSSFAFFKRLGDIINYEHWRNNKSRKKLLEEFMTRFGVDFDEDDLASIHSIEFVNSLCIIKKSSPEKNVVGKRIIAGSTMCTTNEACNLNATSIQDIIVNVSDDEHLDVFELTKKVSHLNLVVAERDSHIVNLSQYVNEGEAEIADLNQTVQTLTGQLTEKDAFIADLDDQILNLKQEVSALVEQISCLNRAMADSDVQIVELKEDNYRRGKWALGLDLQLKDAQAKIMQITSGNSWKITLPLRELRRWLTQPSSQVRKYLKSMVAWIRALYAFLPLSHKTKTMHRLILAKYFPGILRVLNSFSVSSKELCESHIKNCPEAYHISDMNAFASNLEIRTSSKPIVSIIIPAYGQCDYTLRCLASIADHPPGLPFEVIIVDDCSPDDSLEVIRHVRNIRLIGNAENRGFVRSCNIGAGSARGRYLYFLNNDTVVTPGWLDELVGTLHEFPGTGLVGSKLLYPDGSLQEAGCIVWRDGSAWNFGRYQEAALPEYNYAREVDYCSGASIMVPKALFDDLGGFDDHYSPAYCEDADLALKIRDRGYRVIYQPLSAVFHFEGITSGTDTSRGVKAHQIENTKKLFKRWQQRLKSYQVNGEDIDDAKDRRATRRVLILDHCTPTPDQDSGSVDVYNIMLLLREMNYQVTFIPEDNFLYMPEYTPALQRTGIEMLYAPYVTSVEQHLKECGSRYNLVFMFRFDVVEHHIKEIKKYCKKAKVILNTVDLHHLRLTREAKLLNDDKKMQFSLEIKNAEYAAIRAVDLATVLSGEELQLLKEDMPAANICLLPFFRNVAGTNKGFTDRRDILFVGGYQHVPNIDAVKYFVSDIMPCLRKLLPGVRFYIVGSKPPAEIQSLATEDVIVMGFVKNLDSLLDRMRVSVAPLRYGAGIKGKIGTAMAVGLPVVATSPAAEGMSLNDGETILIADEPEIFARKISQIYKDETLWYRLSRTGIAFAERTWGSDTAWRTLDSVLRRVGMESVSCHYPLRLYTESRLEDRKNDDSLSIKEELLRHKKKQFNEFIESGSMLYFPEKDPVLSIILVLHNKAWLSYGCVQSILKNVSVSYEVIIIDNNSTDETNLFLDRIKGATIIRNTENLHFLKANNQALEYVRGEYLLFLNNDAEITESTITSAMRTLTDNENCGAVGGKLILPDGTLQEAGSIIWNDGSCSGYGRNENPDLPEFNFKRVTDYCSGAFLLTKTELFKEHGGFDILFEPAYYEETDYCLWLQQKGLQVVYDPGSPVFHFEFGSGLPDMAIALQRKNQRVFYEKHQSKLQKHYEPDLLNVLMARFAASRKGKRKALYIDDRVPHSDLGAGFPRSNTIVRFINELGYDLTIYPLGIPNEDNWESAYRDIDPYIEIACGYGFDGFEQFIKTRENYFDIIWVSRPHNLNVMSKYILPLKEKCKIIYDAEAIFAEREILKKELEGDKIVEEEKNILYENELRLSAIADVVTAVSENDASKFRSFGKTDVFVLGHTLEINKSIPGFDTREGLLFVGNLDDDASPNVDSVIWFINEIFPIIRQEIPSMTIDIVGSANSARIQSIKQEGVFVHGKVASLADFYNKHRVFIAPTRFAAGIPCKVQEAASFGLPVVATELLCSQLGWRHKEELLSAKIDKLDFAQKLIELYSNKELWSSVQKNALDFVQKEMSAYPFKQKIADILK